jgi:hypothetical protein
MSDETILDDWNPSDATLRRWAFDEGLLLSDQDEDLVLHREEYLPLLIELAGDPTCPKAQYILSCLDFYLMFLVLRGSESHLVTVAKGSELALHSNSANVQEWGRLQERRLQYRRGIGEVTKEQALLLAEELLNGMCRQSDISLLEERADTWEVELSVPPMHQHKERLSINKRSGKFSFTRSHSGG